MAAVPRVIICCVETLRDPSLVPCERTPLTRRPWAVPDRRDAPAVREANTSHVSHVSSNHDPPPGRRGQTAEQMLCVQQRPKTQKSAKLFPPWVTVMQISLRPPPSMSQPGHKSTFLLIPPPTFDLIISALLLQNGPEHKAGG